MIKGIPASSGLIDLIDFILERR